MHVKLADFGIARDDTSDEMTCEAGTYRYMAPKLFSKDSLAKGAKKCYDRKADVYSFAAIVLWSLSNNQIPFRERKDLMAAYATAKNLRPSVDEFPKHLLPLVQYYSLRLATITEIDKTDSNDEEESTKAHAPSLDSKEENISNHDDDGTREPNGGKENKPQSQNSAQTAVLDSTEAKPKKKSKFQCLLTCFRRCFGI